MAIKKEPTVFSLTDLHMKKSKKNKLTKTTMGQMRIDDNVPVEMKHYAEGINDEFYRLLQTNPFVYNYKKATHKAVSVEEFYIAVKKETMPLGAVFRGSEFSKSQKTKWLKKAFKKWKKEFTVDKTNILQKENDKLFVVGDVVVNSFSIASIILMFILLIIIGSLAFSVGSVWGILLSSPKPFLEKIALGINSAFAISWVSLVAQASFSVTIAALFYVFHHNALISDFKKMSKDSLTAYKSSSIQIEKEFKKKFKKTKNYYLTKVGKNPLKVAPLSIEKTATGDVDFEDISLIADSYIKKAAFLKKNKGKLNALKFLFTFFFFFSTLIPIGYALY